MGTPTEYFLISECFSSERGHAGDERAHPNISFFRAQTQTQSQTQHVEVTVVSDTMAALSGSSQNFSGLRCYDRNDDRGMARDASANLRRRGLDLRHRALELRLHRLLERIACRNQGGHSFVLCFTRCKSTTAPPPQTRVLTTAVAHLA